MKNERTLLVEWTDVVIRRVPVVALASRPAVLIKNTTLSPAGRGKVSQAARLFANSPRPVGRIFARTS